MQLLATRWNNGIPHEPSAQTELGHRGGAEAERGVEDRGALAIDLFDRCPVACDLLR